MTQRRLIALDHETGRAVIQMFELTEGMDVVSQAKRRLHVEQGEMISPLFQRPRRRKARKAKSQHAYLIDEALILWIEYLNTFFAPRETVVRSTVGVGTTYETLLPGVTVQQSGHNDPVLHALIQDERDTWAWPKTIHALVMELPVVQRGLLLGTTLNLTQQALADHYKISQKTVSIELASARRRLEVGLNAFEHVRKAHDLMERQRR